MKRIGTAIVNFFKKLGFSLGSSPYLARALVKASGISQKPGLKILELGAGSGIVTREIISSLGENSNFNILENNAECVKKLEKISKGKFHIIHDNATNVGNHITDGSLDVIVSTLPLGSLSKDVVDGILSTAHKALKSEGIFIQYQYWMANKSDVSRYFKINNILLEPRNFSPAFIYVTTKK